MAWITAVSTQNPGTCRKGSVTGGRWWYHPYFCYKGTGLCPDFLQADLHYIGYPGQKRMGLFFRGVRMGILRACSISCPRRVRHIFLIRLWSGSFARPDAGMTLWHNNWRGSDSSAPMIPGSWIPCQLKKSHVSAYWSVPIIRDIPGRESVIFAFSHDQPHISAAPTLIAAGVPIITNGDCK